ncbi:unnamed protein product [Brachionus calyciflorus]|uniref:Uncharacterized protein n=1 Tax=Brachionus calyciflorus TaxID=104777 RepID=A0A813M4F2_9BILA|nr:unnamed protein product [Brachionus calyciflorus]
MKTKESTNCLVDPLSSDLIETQHNQKLEVFAQLNQLELNNVILIENDQMKNLNNFTNKDQSDIKLKTNTQNKERYEHKFRKESERLVNWNTKLEKFLGRSIMNEATRSHN